MAREEVPQTKSEGAVEPNGVDSAGTSNAQGISRTRLLWVDVLIAVTTVALVIAMLSVFANRLLFSPENWSNTSTQLLEHDKIRSATANYLVDQFYANVNVPGVLKSELPPLLQPLAVSAAGALRNAAVQGVDTALTRPRVQELWRKANYAADQAFIALVTGGKGPVRANQGVVTLNLGAIVDNVARRLGLPANVGNKLPPNIANLTVLKAKQLKVVQNGGNAIRGLALWLTILVPLLYALALFLARGHRRRTLMTIGTAAVFAGVLVFLSRSLLVSRVPLSLTADASMQATIGSVVSISTGLLSEVAGAVVLVGAVLVLAAWFAGPARPCIAARRAIAPFLRNHAVGAYAITLAVMGLVFLWDPIPATGTPAGMIVFTLLALFGLEVLRRQTAREFPDARPGDAARALRAPFTRSGAGRDNAPPPESTAEQLRQLVDLRDRGALEPDEYEAAKRQLLSH